MAAQIKQCVCCLQKSKNAYSKPELPHFNSCKSEFCGTFQSPEVLAQKCACDEVRTNSESGRGKAPWPASACRRSDPLKHTIRPPGTSSCVSKSQIYCGKAPSEGESQPRLSNHITCPKKRLKFLKATMSKILHGRKRAQCFQSRTQSLLQRKHSSVSEASAVGK